MKKLIGLAVLAVLFVVPVQAHAVPVDLELSLLVDVSGSVSSSEFNLQKQGYVDAFRDPNIISAIQGGTIGSIACNLIYWSSSNQQQEAVGWTQISDATSGNAFATAIENTIRPYNGVTSISGGIDFAVPLFNNSFEGTREVMDISGDGSNNDGRPVADARDDALMVIDAINGLVIGSTSVLAHYQSNVIGGPDSFAVLVADFPDFGDAIKDKLEREITGHVIPEPATMLLFGLGGLGLAARRIRRRK
jgi:hypothetical protein